MADEIVTKKVNLEVDIIGSSSVNKPNRFQKWIEAAQAVDSWRIFPRAFLTTYIVLLYKVTVWFMSLEAPSLEQSGLVSIVVGAGAAWFGLYAGTSGPRASTGDK
jgi:hypothetical protein